MHKAQSTKTSNNILYMQCLSQQLRKASVLLCLTVDKTSEIHNSQYYTLHKGQGPRPSVTTIKKKKNHPMLLHLLASCCPSLNSLHCPKVKAQNAQYNYTNEPAMVKPKNIIIIIQF